MKCPGRIFVLLAAILMGGCASTSWFGRPPVQPAENPLFVAATDREFLWNNLVDTVDDYFKVQREERVRLVGGVLTEGRIETFYATGSSYLEPWRTDSTPGYEKLHATLQTIRRRATVRVMPAPAGYLIEVTVDKELEDLDHPEQANIGQQTPLRHDGSLNRLNGPVQVGPQSLGWISLGRDASLEQRILLQLRAKFTNPGNVTVPLPPEVNQGAYIDSE
jgi:hypothetical protein